MPMTQLQQEFILQLSTLTGREMPMTQLQQENNIDDARLIFSSLLTFGVFAALTSLILYGDQETQITINTRVSIPACTVATWGTAELLWYLVQQLYILCIYGWR
jgi:hypothetical protein